MKHYQVRPSDGYSRVRSLAQVIVEPKFRYPFPHAAAPVSPPDHQNGRHTRQRVAQQHHAPASKTSFFVKLAVADFASTMASPMAARREIPASVRDAAIGSRGYAHYSHRNMT